MSEEPVDVLIVGSGASGAAFAWSLADTRMNILCLEQGDWMDPSQYPGMSSDWEIRQTGDFSFSPNTRGRREDYPVNDCGSPIAASMFNAVGGSTILYAAHFPRFHPGDFRVRTLDGVADDWPVDYRRLEPFYDVNAHMMGVSGLAGDPAYPPKEVPLPPVALGKLGETLATGFNRLGWHWWPSDSAITTQEHEGRAACINAGTCLSGCAQGAKASTDITYWPAALRAGVRLQTRCRVREITVDENGMADGVIYYDGDGAERRQRAHVVVLACNGIGTPRLLLNSRSKLFPDGLANRSGLVGREPDVPPLRDGDRHLRRAPRRLQGADGLLHHEPGVLRDRSRARLRARVLVRDAARIRPRLHRAVGHGVGAASPGGRTITAPTATCSTARRAWS